MKLMYGQVSTNLENLKKSRNFNRPEKVKNVCEKCAEKSENFRKPQKTLRLFYCSLNPCVQRTRNQKRSRICRQPRILLQTESEKQFKVRRFVFVNLGD